MTGINSLLYEHRISLPSSARSRGPLRAPRSLASLWVLQEYRQNRDRSLGRDMGRAPCNFAPP